MAAQLYRMLGLNFINDLLINFFCFHFIFYIEKKKSSACKIFIFVEKHEKQAEPDLLHSCLTVRLLLMQVMNS